MKPSRAFWSFAILTLCYVGALVYLDERKHVFDLIPRLAPSLAAAAGISTLSYCIRSMRWRWLLWRRHHEVPFWAGFLAYFAGFAYSATPGKVGELVRIRYFSRMGVAEEQVFACFVFERACDLLAVVALAGLLIGAIGGYAAPLVFVAVLFTAIYLLMRHGRPWRRAAARLRRRRFRRAAAVVQVVGRGFSLIATYLNAYELTVSLAVSLLATALQAMGFAYVLSSLAIDLPVRSAIGFFSLASLIGAASMIPGGVGSTEGAMILLLTRSGAAFDAAAVAAISMRLSGLWWAVLLGLVSIAILEARRARDR